MFCILIYSSSKVGHTLNVPMVTILLSGILGYMISPSGDLDCSTGRVQPPPNTGEGNSPPNTTCGAWAEGNDCPGVITCSGGPSTRVPTCTESAPEQPGTPSVPDDAALCAAVIALEDSTACDRVMTTADDSVPACTYNATGAPGPSCDQPNAEGSCPAGCTEDSSPPTPMPPDRNERECTTGQCESVCCQE